MWSIVDPAILHPRYESNLKVIVDWVPFIVFSAVMLARVELLRKRDGCQTMFGPSTTAVVTEFFVPESQTTRSMILVEFVPEPETGRNVPFAT
jgi:hypothetical protein